MRKFLKFFLPSFIIGYLSLVVIVSLLKYHELLLDRSDVWLISLPVPLVLSIGLGIRESKSKHT